MGLLEIGNADAGYEIQAAATEAKKLGADAIIVLKHGSSYAGTYATAYRAGNTVSGFSFPVMAGEASVAVIRWTVPRSSAPHLKANWGHERSATTSERENLPH